MDLGNDHQWLATSQKWRQPDIVCLLMEVYINYTVFFKKKKKSEPESYQTSKSNFQFTEDRGNLQIDSTGSSLIYQIQTGKTMHFFNKQISRKAKD